LSERAKDKCAHIVTGDRAAIEPTRTQRPKTPRSLGTGGWLIANYLSDEFRIKREPHSFLKATKGYVRAVCHFE
jgi:hypothetical protein